MQRSTTGLAAIALALATLGPTAGPATAGTAVPAASADVSGPQCATGKTAFAPGEVTVASYNITGYYQSANVKNWTWPDRRDGLRDQLAGCVADVYTLQEAASSYLRDSSAPTYPDSTSQFEQLTTDLNAALAGVGDEYALANAGRENCKSADNPGYRGSVKDTDCVYKPQSKNPYDNRIVYNTARLELVEERTGIPWQGVYDLPRKNTRRTLHWAQFRDKASGKRFIVATTHLEAGTSNYSLRMRQIDKVRVKLGAIYRGKNLPIVLTGDMNSSRADLKTNPSDRVRYDRTLKMIEILGQDRGRYKTGSGRTYRGKCDVPLANRTRYKKYFVPYTRDARLYAFYDSSTASDLKNNCPKTGWQYNGYMIDYIFTTREIRPQAWQTVVKPSRPYSRSNPYTKTSSSYPDSRPNPSDHNMIVAKLRLP